MLCSCFLFSSGSWALGLKLRMTKTFSTQIQLQSGGSLLTGTAPLRGVDRSQRVYTEDLAISHSQDTVKIPPSCVCFCPRESATCSASPASRSLSEAEKPSTWALISGKLAQAGLWLICSFPSQGKGHEGSFHQ